MKFLVATILTGLLAFALGIYFDWWVIAIAAFVVAFFIPQKPIMATLSGFTGLFLLWGGHSYITNLNNGGVFAAKVAQLLPLGGNPMAILALTAFVGGLVGSLAALSGCLLRKLFKKQA
jgi:hypothetical protein